MSLAASLPSSPSSIFWLTVVLVVLAVATVLIPFILRRQGEARRRIICLLLSSSSLLTAPQQMRDDLEIKYQNERVQDPWVSTLEIRNTGRKDIGSNEFDGDNGLQFKIPVPVIKVLPIKHTPSSSPEPQTTLINDNLQLKPKLIVAQEKITVPLLTEGPIKDISLTLNTLRDIDVDTPDRDTWERQRNRRQRIITWATTGIAGIAVGALILFGFNTLFPAPTSLTTFSCQDLKQAVMKSSSAISNAYLRIKPAQGKKSLSPSDYTLLVASVAAASGPLGDVYRFAAKSGVHLDGTSDVPEKVANAVRILAKLPEEGTGAQATSDLAIVSETVDRLSSGQAIPPQCR